MDLNINRNNILTFCDFKITCFHYTKGVERETGLDMKESGEVKTILWAYDTVKYLKSWRKDL